jgi:pSer/pThr/pTyr-binding forkhead associated (FHA) protein
MTTQRAIATLRWKTETGEVEYRLKPNETVTIGREPDNTIAIDDGLVSRHHAVLEWDGKAFAIQDAGSSNGTFVNGRRVRRKRRLGDGDAIELYKFPLAFEILAETDLTPAPVKTHASETIIAMPRSGESTLIISAGPDVGQEIPLRADSITIGRTSRNATWEVRLADRTVSRPHARIQQDETGFSIVDLESANGTTVNEKKITEPHPLTDGDVIGIGETRLVFRAGSDG